MNLSLILKALILCFGLILPVSNVENNEASIPYYNYHAKLPEYVMDHTFVYQDPPYGRVLDFTIDMSNYENLTSVRIYIPFIRHYNDGNINYKISLIKSDGSKLIINEGVKHRIGQWYQEEEYHDAFVFEDVFQFFFPDIEHISDALFYDIA